MNEGVMDDDEIKIQNICSRLNYCMYLILLVSIIRLITSDFFWFIQDLSTAVMLYCLITTRSRMLALIGMIGGILSLIYSILFAIEHYKNKKEYSNEEVKYNDISPNVLIQSHKTNLIPYLVAFAIILEFFINITITFYSYQGYKNFPMFSSFYNAGNERRPLNVRNNNYASIPNDENDRIITVNNNRISAFGGKGTVVGGI
jgi:hypothetical protein